MTHRSALAVAILAGVVATAQDWPSLVKWVTHWQATLSLNWSEGDIAAVARHLNEKIYGFAMPSVQARQ
jgi:hypothetical protein